MCRPIDFKAGYTFVVLPISLRYGKRIVPSLSYYPLYGQEKFRFRMNTHRLVEIFSALRGQPLDLTNNFMADNEQ